MSEEQHATGHDIQHEGPSAVEKEAMRAAHNVAIRSNEKIFPIFARKLSSGETKDYINTTNKLATWLACEKAYYPAARTKIVELVEIASATFVKTFVRHPAAEELADQLRTLVATVTPFLHLFPEIELQARLQRVVQETSAYTPNPPSTNAVAGPAPSPPPPSDVASASSPTVPPPANLESSMTPPIPAVPPTRTSPSLPRVTQPATVDTTPSSVPDVSNSIASPTARPGPTVVSPTTQPRERGATVSPVVAPKPDVLSQPTLVSASPTITQLQEPSATVSPIVPLKPNVSPSPRLASPSMGPVPSQPTLASPTITQPQGPSATISPIPPPRPQPRRLRKADLPEELRARDLDWFKSSQSAILGSTNTAVVTSSASTENVVGSGAFPPSSTSTSPRKKTARIVPSRRMPRRVPQVEGQSQPMPSLAPAPVSEQSADTSGSFEIVQMSEEVPMDVDDPGPLPQTTTSEPDARVTQEIDAAPVQRRSASSDLQMGSVASTSMSMEQPVNLVDPSTNGEPGVMTGIVAGGSGPSPVFLQSPRSTFNDLDAVPPHSPPLRQLETPILPPPVAAIKPPLNLDFRIPMKLGVEIQAQESPTGTTRQRFDGRMLVVHIIHARPFTHTHGIEMDLTETLFAKIAKWVNRRTEPNRASEGVCVSLGCYRLPEFFKTFRAQDGEQGARSLEELMFNSSCSWPGSSRLSLRVKRDTKDTIVTLSPPLFLTPDQCVDISSLLKQGGNMMEIKQTGDLSEYGLVVHAHHPTRAQMAEVEMVKAADEQWKRFLEAICVKVGPGGKVPGGEVLSNGGGCEGVPGVVNG